MDRIDRFLCVPDIISKCRPTYYEEFSVWKREPENAVLLEGNDEDTIERRWMFCEFVQQCISNSSDSDVEGFSGVLDAETFGFLMKALELAALQPVPRHPLYVRLCRLLLSILQSLMTSSCSAIHQREIRGNRLSALYRNFASWSRRLIRNPHICITPSKQIMPFDRSLDGSRRTCTEFFSANPKQDRKSPLRWLSSAF